MSTTLRVPARTCDCHAHVMADAAAYPYSATSHYRPRARSLEDYMEMAGPLGVQRVVLVQAGTYGTDNSYMLDVLRANPNTTRGVAVIGGDTSDAELEAMHDAGVRAIRLHLGTRPPEDAAPILELFRRSADRLAGLGWHIETLARLDMIEAIGRDLAQLRVPVAFDHMAYTPADGGMSHPGFSLLLDLLGEGNVWVKLSAANRIDKISAGFSGAGPIQKALIAANPRRAIWGTDWPHVVKRVTPEDPQPLAHLADIDNAALLNRLIDSAGDQETLDHILVHNADELYDFGA